jgi:anaerobic magnesium-protoporphyrin IX monomethyl ester cyclase
MYERVILINPPIVSDYSDVGGSGIPYFPIILASVNAVLRKNLYKSRILDLYGMNPKHIVRRDNNLIHGYSSIENCVFSGDVVVIFAASAISHNIVVDIVEQSKKIGAKRIIVIENAQNVASYDISLFEDEFRNAGADYVICGDPELVIVDAIEGRIIPKERIFCDNLDELGMSCWDGFPIQNYWDLPFAHSPRKDRRYIPLLTSRGCPGKCLFCTSPTLNGSRWRARSAENVFREIKFWYDEGVREFSVEDLNPTVDEKRIEDLCDLLKTNKIVVRIKISSGMKIETVSPRIMNKMLSCGFDYISFSPESGSTFILYSVGKKFDHEYALSILDVINKRAITQACFIFGLPEESKIDRMITWRYIKKLIDHGLDEIAIYNFVPIPGSKLWENRNIPTDKISFSSDWRAYNEMLSRERMWLVLEFYMRKFLKDPVNSAVRFFKTKTWMTIKRLALTRYYILKTSILG